MITFYDFGVPEVAGPVPTYVAAGGAAVDGGSASAPAGTQANDIILLLVETANQPINVSAISDTAFVEVSSSPQGTGTAGAIGSTCLQVFWKRLTGAQGAITVTNPGDHVIYRQFAFRGCKTTGNPWNQIAGDVEASATTSITWPAVTTTYDNCLIVNTIAIGTDSSTKQVTSIANASLTSVAWIDYIGSTPGNGGGNGLGRGNLAAKGSSGNSTSTAATAASQGRITIALQPPPA